MATGSEDEEIGVLNCSEFYTDFLSPLSVDVRKGIFSLLHRFNTYGADSAEAAERYTEMLLNAEREIGPEHIVCEFIVREFAESLRKYGLVDEALDLINGRMERIKHEDFGSLLLISRIYDLNGDYLKAAEPKKRARILAERSGDPVLLCLALAKETCNLYNLQSPEEAKDKLNLCLDHLEDCQDANFEKSFPFSENLLRMIDMYKTLGHCHRVMGNCSKAPVCYLKALEIVEKDEKATVQRFKLETQVGYQFSCPPIADPNKTKEYSLRAYDRLKSMAKNESYMTHHSLTVLNAMARVAYSLQRFVKNKFVLNIWQEAYMLGEQYNGQNHPEVARLAADTAFCANKIRENHIATLYVQRAEAILEFCDERAELEFVKTFVREISDSWNLLGKVYTWNKPAEAERCFKQAIAVNTRAYGMSHPRISRLYMSLGYLYKRLNKNQEAFSCFRKCKKITEEFEPSNSEFIQKMRTEMQMMKQLDQSLGISDT